jgi:hypothetical protein
MGLWQAGKNLLIFLILRASKLDQEDFQFIKVKIFSYFFRFAGIFRMKK